MKIEYIDKVDADYLNKSVKDNIQGSVDRDTIHALEEYSALLFKGKLSVAREDVNAIESLFIIKRSYIGVRVPKWIRNYYLKRVAKKKVTILNEGKIMFYGDHIA